MIVRWLWISALGVLVVSGASAEPEGKPAEARVYFEAGNQAYEGGRYLLAAKAYEEAYLRSPLPEIAFSIAQAYRLAYYETRDRHWAERAVERYREYLGRAPTGRRRAHAVVLVASLEDTLASLDRKQEAEAPVEASPPPPETQIMIVSRVPGARGRIEGALRPLPVAETVTPGKHTVHVEAPGHAPMAVPWLAVASRLVVAQVDPTPLPARVELRGLAGGEVLVDGRSVGDLPLTAPISVAPGAHDVAVRARGREPFARGFVAEPGATYTLDVPDRPTVQRQVSFALFAGAGVALSAAAITMGFALGAEGEATSLDDRRRSGTLTPAERDALAAAVGRRDDYRVASVASVVGAVALGVTGALLFTFDLPAVPLSRDSGTGGTRPTVRRGRKIAGVRP